MVDVAGASLLTDGAERALARFRDGSLEYTLDHAQIVARLYQALTEYLEDLVAGTPPQPTRLFPYYRDLQTMLGASASTRPTCFSRLHRRWKGMPSRWRNRRRQPIILPGAGALKSLCCPF